MKYFFAAKRKKQVMLFSTKQYVIYAKKLFFLCHKKKLYFVAKKMYFCRKKKVVLLSRKGFFSTESDFSMSAVGSTEVQSL